MAADKTGSTIKGRVVDAEGNGLYDALLFSRANLEVNGRSDDSGSGSSAKDGTFEIKVPSPARMELGISARGHATKELRFMLGAAESLEDVVIEMNQGATVKGRLILAEGVDATKAQVVDFSQKLIHVNGMNVTTVAADGSYELARLTNGNRRLRAYHPDVGTIDQDVVLREGVHSIDFDFENSLWISGNVFDTSGNPIAAELKSSLDFRLIEVDKVGFGQSRYGGDNRFSFSIPESGSWQFGVSKDGYEPFETTFDIKDEPVSNIRVVLERKGEKDSSDSPSWLERLFG